MSESPPDILTVKEAAELLRCPEQTVVRGLNAGVVPGSKILGRFRADVLEAFLESLTCEMTVARDGIMELCGRPRSQLVWVSDSAFLVLCSEHRLALAKTVDMASGPDTRPTFIYVIRRGRDVKIGFSRDPETRVRKLKATEVIAIVPGTMDQERRLHFLCRGERIEGEWFHDRGIAARVAKGAPTAKNATDLLKAARTKLRKINT